MLRVLSRGTLLISVMNVLEVARMVANATRLSTLMRILDFLEAAGPNWVIVDLNVGSVGRREEQGDPLAWVNTEWCVRARRQLGCISLAPLVGRTTQPAVRAALGSWGADATEVMQMVEVARARARVGTLSLDGTPRPGSGRTPAVFDMLLQKLAMSDLALDRSQLDDLLHACVPLAYADVVFLDKRWPMLLARHPLGRKVFPRARVDDALFVLEDRVWYSS